ncbi:hypothetical protein DL764_002895 [Monosporascus ibericus]|uniref:Uncharacterized protein n=1 Tax=Monosporascus ibericus TaxID=155417 RepID=A0A4Q4TLY5_9PEZI|nr:hypothetical protein DL764_002895 [Monosporascus ibericus]
MVQLKATHAADQGFGCSGLGELLALGKISQEEVDLRNARLESLYALQLLEYTRSFLQADKALDISESPSSDHHDGVLDDDSVHSSDLDPGDTSSDEGDMCDSYAPDTHVRFLGAEEMETTMTRIDMDDDEGIAARIKQALTDEEQHIFAFSTEDEAALCSTHSGNDQQTGKDNAEVLEAIETHKDRLYRVITRTAQFMLSVESRYDSRVHYGWFMLVVANASVESRKRLVRIMSHPGVQRIAL